MPTILKSDPVIRFCDQATAASFYALIFVLPISNALTQWFASLPILFFLISVFRTVALNSSVVGLTWQRLRNRPVDVMTLCFWGWILAMILSLIWSHDPVLGWRALVSKMAQALAVFALFGRNMAVKSRLTVSFVVLMASLSLVSLAGLWQYFFGEDFLRHSAMVHGRISSSLREPTDFAAYLVLTIPVGLAFLFGHKDHGMEVDACFVKFPGLKKARYLTFWMVSVVVVLGVICLGLTYSRGGWLALAAIAAVLSVKTRKRFWPAIGVIAAILGVFIYLIGSQRMYLDHSNLLALTGREGYWQTGWTMVMAHPWTGVGLNAYSNYVRDHHLPFGGYPHNCYLQMAAEIGIPGTLLFVIFFWYFLSRSLMSVRQRKGTLSGTLQRGLAYGLAGFLFHSFFDTFFYSSQLRLLMWLCAGALIAINNLHRQASCPGLNTNLFW